MTHAVQSRLRRCLSAALILFLALTLIVPTAFAAGTLDQSQTDASNTWGPLQGPSAFFGPVSLAQTFTAGLSGRLDQVDLYLVALPAPGTEPITVEIRDVDASGSPGSTVFATGSVAAGVISGWYSVPFSPPASVTAGTRYAIVAYAGGSGVYGWPMSSSENPYPAGAPFYSEASPPSTTWTTLLAFPASPRDLAFRTYVTVAPVPLSGALSMGYWQNKNGQAIIASGTSTSGVCNSGTWLRQYAPFQDLSPTASCSQVGTYVASVVKAANASGASMHEMLKAQMLATSLDVYFSDQALGGNMIGAPQPIGGVAIDLTKICTDLTCTAFEDVGSAFGGATSLTVSQMLAYAASQSSAGSSTWYGNVKATQKLAKDAFSAINNNVAYKS